MKRRFLLFLLVLSSPFWLSLAHAQRAGENGAYQAAKKKATQAFAAGEYEEAALLFKEAFDVEPRGNLLYNIGLCFEKADNLPNAVRFYQRYVDAMPNSKKRGQVQLKIGEIKEKLKDLYVAVNVSSSPPDAIIFVDAKANGAMGKAPVSFKLLPGVYTILGQLEGYELAKHKVTLEESGNVNVNLKMISSGRVGSVTFVIPVRDALLKIDGVEMGKSPFMKPLRLKQGARKIEVIAEGRKPWKRQIQVKAREEQRVQVSFAGDDDFGDSSGGGSIWPWVTVGTGGALLLTGGFFGLQAQSLYGQLEGKRDNNELIAPQDIDTGSSQVSTANILLGAGSVVVTGGLVWWFFDRKPSGDDEASTAQPFIGFAPQQGGAALQLQGAF